MIRSSRCLAMLRISALASTCTLLASCATCEPVANRPLNVQASPAHPHLLFAAESTTDAQPFNEHLAAAQIFARNDPPAAGADQTPAYSLWITETRQIEHLRTINGRPREYTTTINRTIRRAAGR